MSEEQTKTQSETNAQGSEPEQPQADLDKEIIEEYKKIMLKLEKQKEEMDDEGSDTIEEMEEGVQYGL